MRPDLSGQNYDLINDAVNDNEKLIYRRIVSSSGINAATLPNELGKSVRTIMPHCHLKSFGVKSARYIRQFFHTWPSLVSRYS